MEGKKAQLSLIIPVYNEEHELEKKLKTIHNYLKKVGILKDFEIVVVNNGSTDDTQNLLNELSKQFSNIVSVNLKQRGLGLALNKGLSVSKYDAMMFVSIDLGFGAKFIKTSLDNYLKGYDLVLGSKGHKNSIYEAPFQRKIFSLALNKISRLLFKIKCSDTQGTFLITKACYNKIKPNLKSPSPFYQAQVVIYATNSNARIVELPVIYRAGNRMSKIKLSDALTITLELVEEYKIILVQKV